MGTHGIAAGTGIETERERHGRERETRNGWREEERRGEERRGEERREERRGHNDRGRIMTIITIYMQVPSLPAHEQSTHSISYLI